MLDQLRRWSIYKNWSRVQCTQNTIWPTFRNMRSKGNSLLKAYCFYWPTHAKGFQWFLYFMLIAHVECSVIIRSVRSTHRLSMIKDATNSIHTMGLSFYFPECTMFAPVVLSTMQKIYLKLLKTNTQTHTLTHTNTYNSSVCSTNAINGNNKTNVIFVYFSFISLQVCMIWNRAANRRYVPVHVATQTTNF